MTAEDLLQLPDDGLRYELVRGELRKMAPTGDEHGTITMNLAGPLDHYVRTHHLGRVYAAETGFWIARDPDTVLAPDIAFIRQERIETEGAVRGYRIGAPDLVVEVISPSDLYTEVAEKVDVWLAAGTQLVIIVDPRRRTIAVHHSPTTMQTLTSAGTLSGDPVVPGWTLPVREVFE
jgi:Uma2 family endonuclease